MARINFKQLNRRPLVSIVMLLLNLQVEVHTAFCPSACICLFSDEPANNHATCDFGNSLLNVTWSYNAKENISWSSLTCQGMNYTCADMPQFNTELLYTLSIISCTSKVLRCVDHMYPHVQSINYLILHDMVYLNTLDNVGTLKPVRHVRVFSTDVAMEVELAVLNTFFGTFAIDIIGGNVRRDPNLIVNKERQNRLTLRLSDISMSSLPADSFKGFNLATIIIENSNIEHISAAALRGMDRLEYLIVQGNMKLKSIEPEAISNTKILQDLRLHNNLLENIPNDMFSGLIHLEKVSITCNLKSISLGSQAFANLRLRTLEIVNSKISILPEAVFENSLDLVYINLAKNLIQILPLNLFSTTESLEEIILESNIINTVPDRIFSRLHVLKMIDLRNNHIITLSISEVFSLNQVWLDTNNITELDLNMFPLELSKLSVTFNHIQRIVQSKPMLRTIQELDLSNNNISMFEKWWFCSIRTDKLNLSNNAINTVTESHIYIPGNNKTIEVDLRHNDISYIARDKSVLNHTLVRQIRLYLSNNPIECDCSATTVLKDLNIKNILVDYEDIICANSKERLSNTKLYHLCDTKEALMNVIGISVIGSLFILLISISIYCHRNKIWHFIFSMFNCKTDNLPPYQIQLDELKKFDLFVSFAHQDDEFVGNILLPKLENDFCQTVCIHYRDWIVGDLIPDQIIKSVENSRKTIIVLTKHFLLSDWSQLEFQTAHNFSKQERMSTLIIILLDEGIIGDQQLTSDLKSYIVINNYLLWGDPHFWEKLKKVLPRQGKKLKNRYKPE